MEYRNNGIQGIYGIYNHEIYSSGYYKGFIISSNTVRIQGSIKTNISLKPHTARNSKHLRPQETSRVEDGGAEPLHASGVSQCTSHGPCLRNRYSRYNIQSSLWSPVRQVSCVSTVLKHSPCSVSHDTHKGNGAQESSVYSSSSQDNIRIRTRITALVRKSSIKRVQVLCDSSTLMFMAKNWRHSTSSQVTTAELWSVCSILSLSVPACLFVSSTFTK